MSVTDDHSPPQSDIGGHGRTESATAGQLYSLDVHQAQTLFDAAQLPRSLRSITRYCQTHRLDAVTVDGPNGPEWRISEASVTRAIGELKKVFSLSDTASHGEPWLAVSDIKNKDEISQTDLASSRRASDTVRQGSEGGRYVEQLEKRIEEKDETIDFLQEELKDRRTQIGGMKEIIEGQRQLLEVMNGNMAPVFGALAKLVAPKEQRDEPIVARMVEDEESDPSPRGV